MRVIRVLYLAILVFTPALFAQAQTAGDIVKIRVALSVDRVAAGSSFQVAVILGIKSGYHINSNHPSDPNLIATLLKIGKQEGLIFMPVVYTRAKLEKFSYSDKPVAVFEGEVILRFSVSASRNLPAGQRSLTGKLTVQPCNDVACLMPKTIDIEAPFEVVQAGANVNQINKDLFPVRRSGGR